MAWLRRFLLIMAVTAICSVGAGAADLGVFTPALCRLALLPNPISAEDLAHAPEIVVVTHQDDELQLQTAVALGRPNYPFSRLPRLVLASERFGISVPALQLQANYLAYSVAGEIEIPLRPTVVHALGGNVRWCLRQSLTDIVDGFMADPDRARLTINIYRHLTYQGDEIFARELARYPRAELENSELGRPAYYASYFQNHPEEFEHVSLDPAEEPAVFFRITMRHRVTKKIIVFNMI